jgi:UDP-N-acetyl-2-amino-2-deoxyglucuronate dehydrogenase
MKMYRVAIIGLGDMGGHHAQAVQAEENCQLIAGCDTQSQKRKTWGNQFGIMATYQYYIEMIEQEQPDIVIISTQAPDHHDPTLAAAERGIHVLCEKPIALNLVQADRMVDTCKSNKIKFSVNHLKRSSLYNQLALQMIADGKIGQIVQMQARDKGGRKAGNSLMEMGTHLYDWLRLFGGDVEWANAHLTQIDGAESTAQDIKHTQEVHPNDRDAGLVLGERGFISFRFKNGIHSDIQFLAQDKTNDTAYGIDIIGTEGRIAIRESVGTSMFLHQGQHQSPDQHWQRVQCPAEDLDLNGKVRTNSQKRLFLQRLMLRDLLDSIENNRTPFASGEDGAKCLEMIHLSWESHRQQSRVYTPLEPREHPLERWLAKA